MLDSGAANFWQQWSQLENAVLEQSPAVRAAFYRTVAASPLRCTLLAYLAREPDEELRAELRRSLATSSCQDTSPMPHRRKGPRTQR